MPAGDVNQIFEDILNDINNPFGSQANFASRFQGPQFSSSQRRFLGNQFQQRTQGFLGRLGEQIRSGQNPTLTFTQDLDRTFNPFFEISRDQGQNNQFTGGSRLLAFDR